MSSDPVRNAGLIPEVCRSKTVRLGKARRSLSGDVVLFQRKENLYIKIDRTGSSPSPNFPNLPTSHPWVSQG